MQALIDFEGWRKWRGFEDRSDQTPTNTGSGEKSESTASGNDIDKMGIGRLNDSSLVQRRAAASAAAKANLTSDDYVSKGPVHVKSAVPASLSAGSGGAEESQSSNSASTIVASGQSPTLSSGRESRRGSVPVVVPGRK